MTERDLQWLYRRKLEQWARAVADERQALFDALQALAARARREGVVASGEWEFDRWFTRAHLLLVCVRNVWRFASALRELDPDADGMEHLASLEHTLVGASNMPDFLEHFDDYARGTGRAQRRGELSKDDLGTISVDDERGFDSMTYNFGGFSVNLSEAHSAAMLAAQMILAKELVPPERM